MLRPDRLDPKVLHVLVALAAGPSHGYAIRQDVEARTNGAVRLSGQRVPFKKLLVLQRHT